MEDNDRTIRIELELTPKEIEIFLSFFNRYKKHKTWLDEKKSVIEEIQNQIKEQIWKQ